MDLNDLDHVIENREAEKWCEGSVIEGSRFLVTSFKNPKFGKMVERLRKPHQHIIRRKGSLPDDLDDEIHAKAIANTVLKDWEGINRDGKAVKYTPEVGTQVLLKYKEIALDVLSCAKSVDDDLFDAIEDDEKNSQPG